MGLLAEILEHKRAEVEGLTEGEPRDASWAMRDVVSLLRRKPSDPLRLITEIKFRSPSAGALSRSLSVSERARAYEQAGACMLSILTDARWFDGAFENLREARQACSLPLLCKDFIVHENQIRRAWEMGADAVLLIARCLSPARLAELAQCSRERGLLPFFEVVDEQELERAIELRAPIIGVNARDLDTLTMDAQRAARVLGAIPPGTIAVHLSGVSQPKDLQVLREGRADAALLGEALMRKDDPRELLGELVAATAG